MKTIVSRFMKDESGVTAIEYGLIAALVAVGIITALTTLGTSLSDIFGTVSDELDGAGA
jgi:pilus assembly protein Flp/PilA